MTVNVECVGVSIAQCSGHQTYSDELIQGISESLLKKDPMFRFQEFSV